jgi:pyruvate dehydrogenase E1 component alpha subunit
MGAHTSSDDPTRYRLDSDLEAWGARDPIVRYQAWLKDQGVIDDGLIAAMATEAESAAQAMRTRLVALPTPPPGEAIFGRVYSNPPASFVQEREEFEASLEDT